MAIILILAALVLFELLALSGSTDTRDGNDWIIHR
jgi:hypothetical protein